MSDFDISQYKIGTKNESFPCWFYDGRISWQLLPALSFPAANINEKKMGQVWAFCFFSFSFPLFSVKEAWRARSYVPAQISANGFDKENYRYPGIVQSQCDT